MHVKTHGKEETGREKNKRTFERRRHTLLSDHENKTKSKVLNRNTSGHLLEGRKNLITIRR